MKNTLTILTLGLLLFSCSDTKKESTTTSTEKHWYEGGTLHNLKIREWKNATEENKLATCGDFMAKFDNSVTMDILLERAVALRACINEATRGIENVDENETAEIASACTLLLKYKKTNHL